MNAVARAALLSRPHLRKGTDYGFDLREAELIRAEFPQVEILYNLDQNRMEVWAIGEYGAYPNRVINEVPRDEMYTLLDTLRQMKYAAANYRFGQYGEEVRAQIQKERKDGVDEAVNTLDPGLVSDAIQEMRGGRIKPVAVAADLGAAAA